MKLSPYLEQLRLRMARDPKEKTIALADGRTYALNQCPLDILQHFYGLSDKDMAKTLNAETTVREMRWAVGREIERRIVNGAPQAWRGQA